MDPHGPSLMIGAALGALFTYYIAIEFFDEANSPEQYHSTFAVRGQQLGSLD